MQTPDSLPQPDARPESNQLKFKLLALLIALAIVAACIVAIFSVQAARETVKGLAEAFRPGEKYGTILTGAIGQLNNNPKLVVLTADVKATVIQENTSTFAGFAVGHAKVEVSAPAKVQWYVPVNQLSSRDFTYDPLTKRLIVSVPKPVLDTDIVALETDPAKITIRTETGYSPLSMLKGPATRDDAMRHLKEAALNQGGHELIRDRAMKETRDTILKQFEPLSKLLNEGVKLEVEFKE